MESNHLTDDRLLHAGYGVATSADEEHLAGCRQCSESVARLADAVGAHSDPPDAVSEAFWQRQRAAVLEAIARPARRPVLRPAFVLATVLLALVAVGVSLLLSRPQRPLIRAEDEQLFREVCETANRIEPQALAPARLLLPDGPDVKVTDPGQPARATFTAFAGEGGVVFSMVVTAKQPKKEQVRRKR